jgi:Na+/H+ antiporter NhaD/arsenite permease-like protein
MMMMIMAILSETGIFDYMAVYAYKARTMCGMAEFWVAEVLGASIALMMEAVRTNETMVKFF